jgi:hypothetical protein
MAYEPENTMVRELNDDELVVVSGAKPMEAQAGRYQAPAALAANPIIVRIATQAAVWLLTRDWEFSGGGPRSAPFAR